MLRSSLLLAALALPLTACLYSNVSAPLSYGSATPGDANGNLGAQVTGKACNVGILWLVAVGDGGYEAAVKDALSRTPAPFLVDVKADTDYENILLGLYQKQCTRVTGRVPAGGAAPSPAASGGDGKP